jgi:putative spermidine/putrescine transport system permease protein
VDNALANDLQLTTTSLQGELPARSAGSFRRPSKLWLLVLPLLIYFVIFFILPAVRVVRTSVLPGAGVTGSGVTFGHYSGFFSGLSLNALVNTLLIAVFTVLISALVGLVYTYQLQTRPGLRQLQLSLLLAPLLINGVVRIFGLELGLEALNKLLQWLKVISGPLPLVYSMPAVVIAMVTFMFPYMVMSIYASLSRMDISLVEAARTLGAGRWSTLRYVVLPAAMPGVLVGSAITFASSAGSYIVPAMMGGGRVNTIPVNIYSSVSEIGSWSTGAAYSILLTVILGIPVVLMFARSTRSTAGSR